MPILNTENHPLRLQQNWLSHQRPRIEQLTNGNTKENLDDSLTSLNWLQNLNMNYMCGGVTTPPVSPPMKVDSTAREGMKVDPNQVLGTQSSRPNTMLNDYHYSQAMELNNPHMQFERIDYRTNPYVKPSYSYASLICMAMKESRKAKITLSAIYNWITDNFMYYRMADPSWQVSTLISI